jgi:hypothetical protein
LAALNALEYKKEIVDTLDGYVEHLRRKVIYEMKSAMDLVDKENEYKRTIGFQQI